MFERLEVAVKELDAALGDIDESRLTGILALELVDICSQTERMLAGTRAVASRRVEESRAWQAQGHRSEAIQRRRYMTSWVEADGAVRIDARLTPLDGAEVLAAVEQAKNKIFQTARREERRESSGAYMADALVQLVTSGAAGGDTASGPRAMVNVFVDHQALTSGIASAGDVC